MISKNNHIQLSWYLLHFWLIQTCSESRKKIQQNQQHGSKIYMHIERRNSEHDLPTLWLQFADAKIFIIIGCIIVKVDEIIIIIEIEHNMWISCFWNLQLSRFLIRHYRCVSWKREYIRVNLVDVFRFGFVFSA